MKQEEIYNSENRFNDNVKTIYLHKEGEWWRAYEWSAWLCNHIPCDVVGNERLNPIRKRANMFPDGLISVGLKATSFQKYLPCLTAKIDDIDLESGEIVFDVSDLFPEENFDDYTELLKKWKNEYKLNNGKKSKTNDNSNEQQNHNPSFVRDILVRIAKFPIERRTPIETVTFLSEVKEEIIDFLRR